MNSEGQYSHLSPFLPEPLPTEQTDLQREVLRLRDEVIGMRARLAEAEVVVKRMTESDAIRTSDHAAAHAEYLSGVVADLENQLAAIKTSSTWRIGRALLLPVRLVKKS